MEILENMEELKKEIIREIGKYIVEYTDITLCDIYGDVNQDKICEMFREAMYKHGDITEIYEKIMVYKGLEALLCLQFLFICKDAIEVMEDVVSIWTEVLMVFVKIVDEMLIKLAENKDLIA